MRYLLVSIILIGIVGCSQGSPNTSASPVRTDTLISTWMFTLPEKTSNGSVVLANTTLITSDIHGTLYGLNPEKGTQRWTTTLNPQVYTLLSTQDMLYAVSLSETRALNPDDGSTVWQTPLGGFQTTLGNSTTHVLVQDDHGWHALDRHTGIELWSLLEPTPTIPCGHSQSTFYYQSITTISAVDAATGLLRWRAPLEGRCMTTRDIAVFMSSSPPKLHARTGEMSDDLWTHDGPVAGVAVDDSRVYILDHGGLSALDGTTGQLLWLLPAIAEQSAITITTHDEQLYVYTLGGGLYALDRQTGTILWERHDLPAQNPNPYLGFHNDRLYLWPDQHLLEIDPMNGTTTRTFVASTEARFGTMGFVSTPIFNDNRLYVMYESNREPSTIFALDLDR